MPVQSARMIYREGAKDAKKHNKNTVLCAFAVK